MKRQNASDRHMVENKSDGLRDGQITLRINRETIPVAVRDNASKIERQRERERQK